MRWIIAGAAAAGLMIGFASAADATMCTNDCNHSYSVCNTQNGGNAQRICMPKWMQCKKTCDAPAKAPIKVSNVAPKPHR
jgi:hypothetical protein